MKSVRIKFGPFSEASKFLSLNETYSSSGVISFAAVLYRTAIV